MKTSFLDYYKLILEKVSFDEDLFAKEYEKAMEALHPKEKKALNEWLKRRNFGLVDVKLELKALNDQPQRPPFEYSETRMK